MANFGAAIVAATALDSIVVGQWVSGPLAAQIIVGATVKGQIRCNEVNAADNATLAFALYVVSSNGDTLRGILVNTSASDGTARPPEMALTTLTNRQLQNSAEATSISLATLVCFSGDRLVFEAGFRENTTTDRNILLNFGDNSGTDLAEDNTTTTANNPWFEISQTLVFETPDIGTQIPTPCGQHTGDTLYPVGAGQSTGLSNSCGTNWQCVDDTIDQSDGCTTSDSVYIASTTMTWDWYKVSAQNVSHGAGQPAVWKRHDSREQIDALGVLACCHFGGAATTISVQFALMDSINSQDTVFSPIFATATAGRQTFSYYFWRIDSATAVAAGNKWFSKDNPRWDSLSMLGLQLGLGMKVASAAGSRHATCDNIGIIVLTSLRDTTVADSVSPTLATRADSTGNTIHTVHPQGAWNSPLSSKERYWATSVDNAAANIYTIVASDDTGKTWTYMSPDTLHVRRSNDNLNGNVTGPIIFRDTSNLFPDSLFLGILSPATTNTKLLLHRSKAPSVSGSDWASAGVSSPAGRRDSTTNIGRLLGLGHAPFFAKGDTVWVAGGDTVSTNQVGALFWARLLYNAGNYSIIDSGYVSALPITGANGYLSDPQKDSLNAGISFNKRVVMIPWKNGYPAMVVWGWFRDSAVTAGVSDKRICMYRWHPDWNGMGVDSLKKFAWTRSPNSATVDTLTLSLNTTSLATNNGELTGTTVFPENSATGPMAHIIWYQAPFIYHQIVDSNFALVLSPAGKIVEITHDPNGPNTSQRNIAITHRDTMVYAFFTYYKSYIVANTDTNTIAWSLHCGGGKWRGPMPLFWTGASPARIQYKFPEVPYVQYNSHRIIGLSTMGSVRASTAKQAVYSSAIIRPGAWGAGGSPAAPTPLRRRRLIIEKNYKTGALDEKDSIPDWAGLRLPDFTAEEK